MEINAKLFVLILGILFTGLTAGLCFTWSNAVTPGIGKLNNLTYLQSFQAMNRAIINRSFLLVFFSPAILLFINAFLHKNGSPAAFWLFLAAALLYFIGIGLITLFGNVPLNNILENEVLENLSAPELADLRERFEDPWNRWHWQRTWASSAAFILLLIGFIFMK
jgi:uncharacterized membrane protein